MTRFSGYGPLLPDRNRPRLLDLPAGFRYAIISHKGEDLGGGAVVPDNADGMGAFALGSDLTILVRNHEVSAGDFGNGAYPAGDPGTLSQAWRPRSETRLQPGGTTTIVYNHEEGRVLDQYLSLAGTVRNCAGGVTPWGSWLTCEEEKAQGSDHGWVFEVPALPRERFEREARAPQPLRGLGRFRHEAAAVDPRTGIVYLTEDDAGSLFYRFVPNRWGHLAEGGRLEALGFDGVPESIDTSNWHAPRWAERVRRRVRWIPLDDLDIENRDNGLRERAHRQGAARFAYGEGIFFGAGELFFTCTSGGRIRSGQIMRYFPSVSEGAEGPGRPAGELEIFLESTDPTRLNFADNLVVAPNGHLIVCEDPYVGGERNYMLREIAEKLGARSVAYVRGITPNGHVYDIARLNDWTELAGACFSADGGTMFLNIMEGARTVAITGPWHERLTDPPAGARGIAPFRT